MLPTRFAIWAGQALDHVPRPTRKRKLGWVYLDSGLGSVLEFKSRVKFKMTWSLGLGHPNGGHVPK